MKASDYITYDAVGLAALIRAGDVSAKDVVDAAISQVNALNRAINAVTEYTYDLAYNQLETLDMAAPFAGVPYFIKDLHTHVAGSHLAQGSRYLKDYVSTVDSDLVKRLKKAGFIIIGRTNSPEFGLNTTTEPEAFGATLNPWNKGFSAGGSSGGSAAAVASGMVPAAHATDSGGSIRIPASCCGLVGLKPSRGRIFAGLDEGEGWHDLFTAHAVTRSVRDSAAILLVTFNQDSPAPYRCPEPLPATIEDMMSVPEPLTVGVMSVPPSGAEVDSECLTALEKARTLLEEAGHTTVPIHVSIDTAKFGQAVTLILSAKVAAVIDSHEEETGIKAKASDFESAVWHCIELGRTTSASALNRATAFVHLTAQEIARQTAHVDVVMSPTVAKPPLAIGTLVPEGDDISVFLKRVFEFAPFTVIYNATGQPAISLPTYWSADGMPIGVQFAAKYGREDILFKLAAYLENSINWKVKQQELLSRLCVI